MQSKKIISVKKIGEIETMDIEVNSVNHIFYGDGIATSNSHGVCYAFNAYHSAYEKVHNTTKFFVSYLTYANEKQDPHEEVSEVVSEAKLFNINIMLPKITFYKTDFYKVSEDTILFGLKSIKSLTGVNGDNVDKAIKELCQESSKEARDFSWLDILIYLSPKINSTAFTALCSIGFFSHSTTKITRNRALYEYKIFKSLTDSELKWVVTNYPLRRWASLLECMKDLSPTKKLGGGTSKAERSIKLQNEVHFLINPPYSLEDTPSWIVAQEKKLLGCPVSMAMIESSDTSSANTTCKEIVNGKYGKFLCVAGSINRMNTCKVKNGKMTGELMSFLTIEDETCVLDNVVIFPAARKQYEYCLYENNNLLFCGSVDKHKPGFVVEKIYEI